MNSKTAFLVISATVLLFFSGCSSVEKNLSDFQARREVENNVLSSSFPRLHLKVSNEFAYLGSVQAEMEKNTSSSSTGSSNEGTFDAVSYLFVQPGPGGGPAKGIIVRILTASGDPNQEAQRRFLKEIQPRSILESGKMKILEEEYRNDLVLYQELFTKEEKNLLQKPASSSCFLVKRLEKREGFGGKARALIYYFEDIAAAGTVLACGGSTGVKEPSLEQKRMFHDFTERSYRAVRFLNAGSVVDATSRYVDPGTGESASGARTEDGGVPEADPVEKRLETLKGLYEKSLITKEEYEKKKADILKDL